LALAYFRSALALCRLTGTPPSILLHPLDFLGGDDEKDLSFFPAMNLPGQRKLKVMDSILAMLARHYRVVPMREHAAHIEAAQRAPRLLRPNFPGAPLASPTLIPSPSGRGLG
jgi:hypothetical protein